MIMEKRTPPVALGDLVEVRPRELVAGGESLAKIEGFPLFVRALYPGDAALVRVTEVKSGFARARVETMVEQSGERRAEPCSLAGVCGGCDWTALRLDAQLAAKRRILESSLRRVGKFSETALPPITLHPSPLSYRIRSRLHVDPSSREIGFYALRSHQVVPLARECEVVGPEVIRHLDGLREHAREEGNGKAIETFESGSSFSFCSADQQAQPMTLAVGDFSYHLSTKAFFQVNRHLLPKLLELVSACASQTSPRNVAFDLYAGVGFFTLPLSRLFEIVYGVEGSEISHSFAKLNASGHQKIRLFNESVEQFFKRGMRNADLILVDPPRGGLTPAVIEGIDGTMARRVCYLSCDPVTFSRDAARLTRRGWSLRSLDLVDLFPNTHHIETLSSFEREP